MTVLKADNGKARMDLVPLEVLEPMAKVREFAFGKYGADGISNWDGVEDERYLAALLRHLVAYQKDNNAVDEESGLPAIYHCLVNAAFLAIKHQRRMKAENNSNKQIDNEVSSNEAVFPNKISLPEERRWIEENYVLYPFDGGDKKEFNSVSELFTWMFDEKHLVRGEHTHNKFGDWIGGCYRIATENDNNKLFIVFADCDDATSAFRALQAYEKTSATTIPQDSSFWYYPLKKRVDKDV